MCMFIMARKRATTESRIQSALHRNLANSRSSSRGRSNLPGNESPPRVFTLPIYPFDAELPKYDDAIKFPPSYEEALRMRSSPTSTSHTPLSPTTSLTSAIARTGSEASDSTASTSVNSNRSESPKPGRSVAVTIEEENLEDTNVQNRNISRSVSVPKIEIINEKEISRPETLSKVIETPCPTSSDYEVNKKVEYARNHNKSDSSSSTKYGDVFNV
uniref:Uncharacterized protein n=1 Tax=Acrobeloides nanus TaxID=290746 RepID=A0A914CDM2_9BILA